MQKIIQQNSKWTWSACREAVFFFLIQYCFMNFLIVESFMNGENNEENQSNVN